MTDELHVILGGGHVGQPLVRILGKRGLRVRMVKRSAGAPGGIELMQGDATDPNFCREAARGAATVYHCMNPPIPHASGRKSFRSTSTISSAPQEATAAGGARKRVHAGATGTTQCKCGWRCRF